MIRKTFSPFLIAFEMTRKCYLNCKHCRANADTHEKENELSTGEIFKILDNIKSSFSPIIILTGGEPMLRADIYEIAKYGTSIGLRMTMAPCGLLLNDKTMKKIKDSGIQRISLSLDGAAPETHDEFRQKKGSFDVIIEATSLAKKYNVDFQINTTIHKNNMNELPEILNMAVKLGAKSLHPFILVPTGRAKNLALDEITAEEYESILAWFAEIKDKTPIFCKPTCAPHYYRIVKQKEKELNSIPSEKKTGMHAFTKGCMGGQSFSFISSTGKVQICGFLDVAAGNLRSQNYDFVEIWNNSPLFKEMRDIDNYHGKCGICEFKNVCSGCRARAYAFYNDYLAEEPFCTYIPEITEKTIGN
jgi:AdoMet-dependent heme synthase